MNGAPSFAFHETLNGCPSWAAVFQSIPAFEGLIARIYAAEGITPGPISHLTAGTNAVFRVGGTVAKIFAPEESGYGCAADYEIERMGMRRALSLGVRAPRLLAASQIDDRYRFRYMILEYIDGPEAREALASASDSVKAAFARQIADTLRLLNGPLGPEGAVLIDIEERPSGNPGWDRLPPVLAQQARAQAAALRLGQKVYVHGDVTGDNVLVGRDGEPVLLDFADGRLAPREYELPPVLFDLFDFDPGMIGVFRDAWGSADLAADAIRGVLMHEYGPPFVQLIVERLLHVPMEEISDLDVVWVAVRRMLTN